MKILLELDNLDKILISKEFNEAGKFYLKIKINLILIFIFKTF